MDHSQNLPLRPIGKLLKLAQTNSAQCWVKYTEENTAKIHTVIKAGKTQWLNLDYLTKIEKKVIFG